MRKVILICLLLCASAVAQTKTAVCQVQQDGKIVLCHLQNDWKRAIWRVFPHVAMSVPFAVVSLPFPDVGQWYIKWRRRSEKADERWDRDTAMKAAIDFYSQTALVSAVLKTEGIKP